MKKEVSKAYPIKDYKGFNMDFTCKHFQYEVGKEYHRDGDIELCRNGFHACENPIEVFNYYTVVGSRFVEVELWGSVMSSDDDTSTKLCASDIRIIREMSVSEMTEIGMEWYRDKCTDCRYSDIPNDEIAINEIARTIVSEGMNSSITLRGGLGRIMSCGDRAKITSIGDFSKIFVNGDHSNVLSEGTLSCINVNGYNVWVNNNGSGARICSTGDRCTINGGGYGQYIYSDGPMAKINVSGDYSEVVSTGEKAVITSISIGTKVKAKKGSRITLMESDGSDGNIIINTEYVDGDRIKEDTWYRIENGEFKDVNC